MKHTIHQIKPEQFEYLIDTNKGQSGSAIWISKFGATMILGVHTSGGKYTNTGVRLSKEKFEVLIQKIAESYEREKPQGTVPQPSPKVSFLTKQHSPQQAHAPKPHRSRSAMQFTLPSIAFGAAKWAQYFGDVDIETPLPADIDQILSAPCPFWPEKRVQETHLLTLIPATANNQPFTLNSLSELIQKPRDGGKATRYSFCRAEIKKAYGSIAPITSHWVLMTKDVIPESRKKKFDDQKQLLATHNQKSQSIYEIPRLLESVTSILIEHVQSGIWLYTDFTSTRCQEMLPSKPTNPLVIGDFNKGGIYIDFYSVGAHKYYGVGACRKL